MGDFSLPAVAGRVASGKLLLGDLKPTTKALTTVAEYDVTPGLHEWIEGEIRRLEAESPPHGCDCNALPTPQSCSCSSEDYCECADYNGFDPTNCDCPWPAEVARRCAADRKILAAHEYAPFDPRYADGITFGCGTCHTDGDGCAYAGGNCATILALAEGYGLEAAGDADVEVVRD